ncbi:MAG: hypothetical protein WA892_13205, partial [Ornithinimicrobium sp.]
SSVVRGDGGGGWGGRTIAAAWILVTVYGGPVALMLYLLARRRPFPGAHEEVTWLASPSSWRSGVSLSHEGPEDRARHVLTEATNASPS